MAPTSARLLLADDEAPLLESLASAARSRGWSADAARDGQEALEMARQASYDLVVTDLRMPRLEGTELIAALLDAGIGTRVIVVTGYATLEAAVDCLRKGAMDFLIKPFAVEDFLRSAEKALARALPGGRETYDWDGAQRHFGLTRRQRDVLEAFYATGRSPSELAVDLCLSTHTVRSHLKTAYVKLGVSTRAQLLRALRDWAR